MHTLIVTYCCLYRPVHLPGWMADLETIFGLCVFQVYSLHGSVFVSDYSIALELGQKQLYTRLQHRQSAVVPTCHRHIDWFIDNLTRMDLNMT